MSVLFVAGVSFIVVVVRDVGFDFQFDISGALINNRLGRFITDNDNVTDYIDFSAKLRAG